MDFNPNNHQGPQGTHLRDRNLSSIDAEISVERLRKIRGLRHSALGCAKSYYEKMLGRRLGLPTGFNEAR